MTMNNMYIGDNTIDSLDVIARIEEIESDQEDCKESGEEFSPELVIELRDLLALQEGAEGYSDWIHGEQLILDSYFEEHARELADALGALPEGYSWPTSHIDWEEAARELQVDYTAVEVAGYTYWIR